MNIGDNKENSDSKFFQRIPLDSGESGGQPCEASDCPENVFSACSTCTAQLCEHHFLTEHLNCSTNVMTVSTNSNSSKNKRKLGVNRREIAKNSRLRGEAYVSASTNKIVPARTVREPCQNKVCERNGKKCVKFSEQQRKDLFTSFYSLENLQLQREYIARYCYPTSVARRRTSAEVSRRTKTLRYTLPLNGDKVNVCKTFFINTLGITDKIVQTVIMKLSPTGIVEKDQRGKKPPMPDLTKQISVQDHIKKIPKIDAKYIKDSNLTLPKLYKMYVSENSKGGNKKIASYSTYRRIFKDLKLTFDKPCNNNTKKQSPATKKTDKLITRRKNHVSLQKKCASCGASDHKTWSADCPSAVIINPVEEYPYFPISTLNKKSNEISLDQRGYTKIHSSFTLHDFILQSYVCELNDCEISHREELVQKIRRRLLNMFNVDTAVTFSGSQIYVQMFDMDVPNSASPTEIVGAS